MINILLILFLTLIGWLIIWFIFLKDLPLFKEILLDLKK